MEEKMRSNVTLLKEIAELLNEETEIIPMLQGALRKFLTASTFQTGWIFFIDSNGKKQLVAEERLPEELQKNDCNLLRKGGCSCISKYRQGDLKKATNMIECQRIEHAMDGKTSIEGITHHATVPLQSGKERFGILNVATPNIVAFEQDELALLESVAFQMGSAIKRIMLTKQEQEIALIEERNRLARDLHDSVNQLLFSVTLTARGGVEMSEIEEVKQTFSQIQQLTQEALTEMRALIWQLRPKGLETGLVEGIKGYAEMIGINLTTNVSGVLQLPSKVEENLFRIAQEGLNNIQKHAQIDNAELYITATTSNLLFVLRDEGKGFVVPETAEILTLGMESICSRVQSVGGTVEWISEIGKGTELFVRLRY